MHSEHQFDLYVRAKRPRCTRCTGASGVPGVSQRTARSSRPSTCPPRDGSEAPRGTLFHHYQVDENGLLQKVNLIIATGQNALAMNRTVTQIARRHVRGTQIPESALNRVEAGIRAFDPCLSCSTHAAGQMPLVISLLAADGRVLHEVRRD